MDNLPLVTSQARCEPPIRPAITSTVQIEEIEDIECAINEQTMSPLMQERMKRMRDMQETLVDGIPVPKKKAKAQPAPKAIPPLIREYLERDSEMKAMIQTDEWLIQNGSSSSSKD